MRRRKLHERPAALILLALLVSSPPVAGVVYAAQIVTGVPMVDHFLTPAAMQLYREVVLLVLLIYYRRTKRFKERPVDSWPAYADHNSVELIFLLMLVPGALSSLQSLAALFNTSPTPN